MRTIRSRRAVSPVIATVILVAVAITVAVAVAYWMGGIAGQYTKFEKVEIQSGVCTKEGTGAVGDEFYWKITMKLKNTGTATATLIGVFINDVEVDVYEILETSYLPGTTHDGIAVTDMDETKTIESGDIAYVNIFIDYPGGGTDDYKKLTSGTTINIKIHSAGGMDYIKLAELV